MYLVCINKWQRHLAGTAHQGLGGQFRFIHALPMYPTIMETLGRKEVIYGHFNKTGPPRAPLSPLRPP